MLAHVGGLPVEELVPGALSLGGVGLALVAMRLRGGVTRVRRWAGGRRAGR